MKDTYDVIVIGGGILGLAVAMKMGAAHPIKRIAVVEKERDVACHQTGHNSGVIHSGIYYRPGSLKARLCVDGAEQMYRFCTALSIPFERCGKIVAATSHDEIPRLQELHRKGTANGVQGLRLLSPEDVLDIEPHVRAVRGMRVPSTGIVDFRAVTRSFARTFEGGGGAVLTGHEVTRIRNMDHEIRLETCQGELCSKAVVNCAGLHADRIARLAGAAPPCQIVPFRGEYYTVRPEKAHLVRNLIYPVPDPRYPFLGVHFTRMVDGTVEAGPNAVLAFAREGYSRTHISFEDLGEMMAFPGLRRLLARHWKAAVGEMRRSLSKRLFTLSLQKLVPSILARDLAPGGTGVRAQAIDKQGSLLDDFVIVRHGRMAHVLNAPSPAATSSLAIADYIVEGCGDLL